MVRLPIRAAAAVAILASALWSSSAPRAQAAGGDRSDGFAVFRYLVSIGLGEAARERLVAHGGQWEQADVACERPKVGLGLDSTASTFELRIESRCRGQAHVSEFAGTWKGQGEDRLILEFPDPDQTRSETLACAISVCDDGSGEDCIACEVASDLSFELRVVRR